MGKAIWAEASMELAEEQTYCNFKSEATKSQGDKRALDAEGHCMRPGEVMNGLQEHETRRGRA